MCYLSTQAGSGGLDVIQDAVWQVVWLQSGTASEVVTRKGCEWCWQVATTTEHTAKVVRRLEYASKYHPSTQQKTNAGQMQHTR